MNGSISIPTNNKKLIVPMPNGPPNKYPIVNNPTSINNFPKVKDHFSFSENVNTNKSMILIPIPLIIINDDAYAHNKIPIKRYNNGGNDK